MIKFIHVFFILVLLKTSENGSAQRTYSRDKYGLKKMVTIPPVNDSSASGEYCVCKIIRFSNGSENRVDGIFVSNPADTILPVRELVKNIDKELQQALWFYDKYKVVGQYASAASCRSLYQYLRTENQEIKRSTFITASYMARR